MLESQQCFKSRDVEVLRYYRDLRKEGLEVGDYDTQAPLTVPTSPPVPIRPQAPLPLLLAAGGCILSLPLCLSTSCYRYARAS